jgi:hypothetical protein
LVSSAIIIFSFSFFGQEPFSGSKGEGATLFASGYVYGRKEHPNWMLRCSFLPKLNQLTGGKEK